MIGDNSALGSAGEQSAVARARKSSKDKWDRHRILQRGRFPSGFPRNMGDVWRTCRCATRSRIRVLSPEIPREYRARDYSSAFIQTICSRREDLMRSFPEKPQRSEQQHAGTMRTAKGRGGGRRNNDTLGKGPSIILCRFECSCVTWTSSGQTCGG